MTYDPFLRGYREQPARYHDIVDVLPTATDASASV